MHVVVFVEEMTGKNAMGLETDDNGIEHTRTREVMDGDTASPRKPMTFSASSDYFQVYLEINGFPTTIRDVGSALCGQILWRVIKAHRSVGGLSSFLGVPKDVCTTVWLQFQGLLRTRRAKDEKPQQALKHGRLGVPLSHETRK